MLCKCVQASEALRRQTFELVACAAHGALRLYCCAGSGGPADLSDSEGDHERRLRLVDEAQQRWRPTLQEEQQRASCVQVQRRRDELAYAQSRCQCAIKDAGVLVLPSCNGHTQQPAGVREAIVIHNMYR